MLFKNTITIVVWCLYLVVIKIQTFEMVKFSEIYREFRQQILTKI